MKSLIQLVRCIQELLRDAAKARISRMTKPKRKRSDLSVPEFVAEQWKKGTKEKDEMADLLMHPDTRMFTCARLCATSARTNSSTSWSW